MLPAEFRAVIGNLGWSPSRTADCLDVPLRTVYAWADEGTNGRDMHSCAALLLLLAEAMPAVRAALERYGDAASARRKRREAACTAENAQQLS